MFASRVRILWEEQEGICWYCKRPVRSRLATVDHVLAKAKGGTNMKGNLVMACRKCNRKKGSKLTHRVKTPGRLAALLAVKACTS